MQQSEHRHAEHRHGMAFRRWPAANGRISRLCARFRQDVCRSQLAQERTQRRCTVAVVRPEQPVQELAARKAAAASEQSVQLAEQLEQQPEQPMQKPEQAVPQSLQPEQTKQAFPIISSPTAPTISSASAPPHASCATAVMLPYLLSSSSTLPIRRCPLGVRGHFNLRAHRDRPRSSPSRRPRPRSSRW